MASKVLSVVVFVLVLGLSSIRSDAAATRGSREPFSVTTKSPTSVRLGEVFHLRVEVENNGDETLFATSMLGESPQFEILSDATRTKLGENSTCLWGRNKTVHTYRVRPLVAEVVNLTVGMAANRKQNSTCDGADPEQSDYIYVSLLNVTVHAEGFKRDKVLGKYVCAEDLRAGKDTLEPWRVETPPEAMQGSVKAWISAAPTFMTIMNQRLDSPLLHNRGDIDGLTTAINQYLLVNFVGSERNISSDEVAQKVKAGHQRQLPYRLSDNSYAIFGSREKEVSSWMTAYILTIAALTSQPRTKDGVSTTRETWNWLNTLQRDEDREDGCFDHVGRVYNDFLRNDTTGNVSRVLLTAYSTVALGISAWDGPPHINPFKVRDCLLKDNSSDPFVLALKAHALGVTKSENTTAVLKQLLDLANKTEQYIYWNITQEANGTNSKAVLTASYAAMAMLTTRDEFRTEVDKIIRWLATQMNSQGGFNSIFDTMMGVRALLDSERRELKVDTEVDLRADGVNQTLTFNDQNFLEIERVDLPTLPTTVNVAVTGNGCAMLQAVVQYSVLTHCNSSAFNLTVNSTCEKPNRIEVCTAYLLNRTSNLVAVEVNLVSGYTPVEEDLEKIVASTPAFSSYEVKGSQVTLFADNLTAKETCVDFGVTWDCEVEEVKPGVVIVYDYYQPEVATSTNFTFPSESECPGIRLSTTTSKPGAETCTCTCK